MTNSAEFSVSQEDRIARWMTAVEHRLDAIEARILSRDQSDAEAERVRVRNLAIFESVRETARASRWLYEYEAAVAAADAIETAVGVPIGADDTGALKPQAPSSPGAQPMCL